VEVQAALDAVKAEFNILNEQYETASSVFSFPAAGGASSCLCVEL
jgi:hypothetical protein